MRSVSQRESHNQFARRPVAYNLQSTQRLSQSSQPNDSIHSSELTETNIADMSWDW